MLPPKKSALAITDFTSCSSCYCVLFAMNIKIFPSEIAGDMPVVIKLPGCIQLKYHAILVVISGCANKMKCLIPEKAYVLFFLMVKAWSF